MDPENRVELAASESSKTELDWRLDDAGSEQRTAAAGGGLRLSRRLQRRLVGLPLLTDAAGVVDGGSTKPRRRSQVEAAAILLFQRKVASTGSWRRVFV